MITDEELQRLKTQAEFMAATSDDGGHRQRHWRELTEVFSELQERRRGEYICAQCGLRKNSDPVAAEF